MRHFRCILVGAIACMVTFGSGIRAPAQLLADSKADFSGVQGQKDWSYGYRNYTAEAATADDYDPAAGFVAFPGGEGQGAWDGSSQTWDSVGGAWDLNTDAAGPWTWISAENVHPNGVNSPPSEEHWVIRRWTANQLTAPTSLAVVWNTRKQNTGGGSGVTGGLWYNGKKISAAAIAGTDGKGVTRTNYLLNVKKGEVLDLVLSPVGIDGDRSDGADGTFHWMTISAFTDSDGDGLPDPWEIQYAGDLTKLNGTGDFDKDGLTDITELARGTDPAKADSDGDGLADGVETNTGKFVSASDTGTDPLRADTDGDGRRDGDEVNINPKTDPFNPDSDGDTYSDGLEVQNGHNPNDPTDTLISSLIANSVADFSGEQGKNGWTYGYRNASADGGSLELYDPNSSFTKFAGGEGLGDWDGTTQIWAGSQWDLNTAAAAPWDEIGPENVHPNGPSPVHWVIRRWSPAGVITKVTPLALRYNVRKTNLGCGNGVTAGIYINGHRADTVTLAFNNGTGATRTFFANVAPTDVIDLILSPRGTDNANADGCDGSVYSLVVDPVLPEPAYQSDGALFIPVNPPDTDSDGMADLWEKIFFPGDLTKLTASGDFDGDGLKDPDEFKRDSDPTKGDSDADGLGDSAETKTGKYVSPTDTGSDPRKADSDGDGLSDQAEVTGHPVTDPNKADTDGDGFSDADEVAEGTDPTNPSDNVLSGVIANSIAEFSGTQGKNGWYNGYRNVTADGGGAYDPKTQFIPYAGGEGEGPWDGVAQMWDGSVWDLNTAASGPWTFQGSESIHPNGVNSAPNEEHWSIRRWVADELTAPTPVTLIWQVKKENPAGDGVGALLFVNGTQLDAQVIAGGDSTNPKRKVVTNLKKGDTVDLALTPENADGTRGDGSDGSITWFWVDTRVAAASVKLTVVRNGSQLTITSDPQPLPTGFVLEAANAIGGPWTELTGITTPGSVTIGSESARFLRAAKR